MISRLSGVLLEKQAPQIVIDVGGVGYELDVSLHTFYALPALNERVSLLTQLIVREDAHLLFGFGSRAERDTFRLLLKVSGIGAKTAMGILSALTSEELAVAVAAEDIKRLSAAPGIGKKTAERMVLELRGKLTVTAQSGAPAAVVAAAGDDIVHTLLALGYSEREAQQALKALPPDVDVEAGVRLALKNMLK